MLLGPSNPYEPPERVRTQLPSEDALLHDMRLKLAANDYRFSTLVETIVTSPQFLNKRGESNPTKETRP